MTTTIIDAGLRVRTHHVLEKEPRASREHVGQVASTGRSEACVHLILTDAAAEALAVHLNRYANRRPHALGDFDHQLWSRVSIDLVNTQFIDSVLPADGDVVDVPLVRVGPKHRADRRERELRPGEHYMPRHARSAAALAMAKMLGR